MRRLALLLAVLATLLAGCGSSGRSHAHLWLTPGHAKRAYAVCVSTDCGPWSVTLNWQLPAFPNTTGYYTFLNGAQEADVVSSPFRFVGWDCGTSNTLGVEAHDGSGHHGPLWTVGYTAPACPAASDPATIHVAQAAAGANNGTSCANAEAVSVLGTSTDWTAGQVIGLCGTITSSIVAHGSGASGNPITVYWEPNAAISEPVCVNGGSNVCFSTNGQSYLTLNGGSNGVIQATADGTGLANQIPEQAIWAMNCSGCTFENLTIANMYVHTSVSDTTIDASQDEAIRYSGPNVTIANNTIHDVGWALVSSDSAGDTNQSVHGNDIYNIDHGLAQTSGCNDCTIGTEYVYGNHIHDFDAWNTTTDAYHHDGIHCYNNFSPGGISAHYPAFYIYNNRFGGTTSNNFTGMIWLEDGGGAGATPCADSTSNIYVFNNVIQEETGSGLGNGLLGVMSTEQVFAYNNTFLGGGVESGSGIGSQCFYTPSPGTGSVRSEDNLFSGCGQDTEGSSTSFAAGGLDYNLYAVAGSTQTFLCSGTFYAFTQLASWRSCTGQDAHACTAATANLNADGSPSGTPSGSDACNGSTVGEPAVGAGVNLTSVCSGQANPGLGALCSNISGVARPSSGAWNIGAY